jgi:hypothetical protein
VILESRVKSGWVDAEAWRHVVAVEVWADTAQRAAPVLHLVAAVAVATRPPALVVLVRPVW